MIAPSQITPPPSAPPPPSPLQRRRMQLSKMGRFFAGYAWLIVKNLIGWALILISPFVGFTFPGPGGIPLFFIGFALITFPGKRKLTARVMRGRPMNLDAGRFNAIEIATSILLPAILFWPFEKKYWEQLNLRSFTTAFHLTLALVAISATWVIVRFAFRGINLLIMFMPRFRRRIRPWLRRHGILLLPPRHHKPTRGLAPGAADPAMEINDEIIEIHERHRHRALSAWQGTKPWIRRAAGLTITVWIFATMFRPLHDRWPDVKDQVRAVNWGQFMIASVMFSVFLLLFRAISWRRVLKGFGYRLPVWAAVRIWSTSEMARYIPLAVWQVFGRVLLIKPYGVNAIISSTSQVLELCIFLFANVLVAGSCLLWYAAKMTESTARHWLIAALCLMPALAVLLHPKIFYGLTNRILRWFDKPPIVKRLRGWKLVKLLAYIIGGLLWQSLAVFLIAQPVLHLKIDWWWMVAASYCLAWTAGFLAFWSPAGMGVREIVFAQMMMVVTPPQVQMQFANRESFHATVIVLGFILRLWTIVGELILCGASLVLDYRGALGRSDAPGRVPTVVDASPTPPPAA